MADIPAPQDVIGFIVFFFPGFVSLLIAANLTDTELKDRSLLEVIVLSFVFSALTFGVSGSIVPIGTNLLQAETTMTDTLTIFASSVLVGIVVYVLLGVWLSIARRIAQASIWLRRKLLSEIETFGPSSAYLLDRVWESRDKNHLVVTTKSGEIYRGRLGSYSIKPKYEIVLEAGNKKPISKYSNDRWEDLAEWAVLFPEEDISRIHVREV